ncbi:alpha/beta hydrolase family protein [Vulcaniibacterium tengchongense]|uniref:Dipeptidyl aminopeptidase/acylaminoacyl peptidase n=1 Tax=Vulcaniibacterium tengchongense TaxID=1273429 RepID=A0A3N4VEJ6_9GAMM|nr:S9 family peptidase [Vulcaniibacterium tengchongense]RPE81068.1 dipeptidyl aminopeptidase/acylaminoacyl peptidase [Vulcaniibacterium tengchongense]
MIFHRALLPLVLASLLPTSALAARGFEARDLATLDRVSSPTLSPDGRKVVFAKRTVDLAANKATTSLWIEDLFARDAAPPVRLTPEGWSVNSPSFSPDGGTVYFLSAKSGSSQLYAMPTAGGTPTQLTDFPVDVGSYKLSPDGTRIAFHAEVFPDCAGDLACSKRRLEERGQRKSSGVLFERVFIRHWDAWNDGRLNRLFVATLPGSGRNGEAKPVAAATLVGADVIGDVPSKPFGDASEYTWAPDGRSLVFSARLADAKEPTSTNFDLYQAAADGRGAAKNLTADNPAWDTGATFAADGKTLYYRAMKRPGFEADRFALIALDLASGQRREIAPNWDRSAETIVLSADGRTLYTTATDLGEHPLFAVDVASGAVRKAVGEGSVSAFDLAGPTLVLTRNTLKTGDVLYATSADASAPLRAITPATGEVLKDVAFGDFEQFSFKGWNGDTVYGYVVKPWNYAEGRKYPVAFLIHGGPQGSFGNGWSYRWNPQTYAGQGYAVVMIDFHGSTGYGQAFTDAISQHWGDRPLEDLQKGWAAAQKRYRFLDGDKACALGASYGGFMVNWIAGNWNAPWKCLVSHDGVFDQRMMGYATEELWFTEWENGGTPFDKPANYEKFNPVNHVDRWRVPMLVIHGQQDFRIPVEQGIGVFTALQRRGIESQFLYFPDENHWVLKPQNSVQWHDTVNAWLKKHIGP